MLRRFYIILIAAALIVNGAMPTMAMVSGGPAGTALGASHQALMADGLANTHRHARNGDTSGLCDNFCLDCGCLNCQARSLAGPGPGGMIAIDHFPSPRLPGHAARLDRDVAKPPPKS